MLLFGAVVYAGAMLMSGGWNFAQASARVRGVPVRRTMNAVFPYVTLGVEAFKWMGIWALTSASPFATNESESESKQAAARWRRPTLRLLATASFILLSLRIWGVIGGGLRPAFNGATFSLVTQGAETIETILIWLHLRAIAMSMDIRGLAGRSVAVLVGRGGTLALLYVLPTILALLGEFPRLTWDFINVRYCLSVLWDVVALVVLLKFALVFLRARVRAG
jgi:hypothetical protein